MINCGLIEKAHNYRQYLKPAAIVMDWEPKTKIV